MTILDLIHFDSDGNHEQTVVTDPLVIQTLHRANDLALDTFWSAKQFLSERFPNYKAIRRHLRAHPEIRTVKPGKQRLSIHVGDWYKTTPRTDPLDLTAAAVDAARELEQQKAEIRSRKAGQ